MTMNIDGYNNRHNDLQATRMSEVLAVAIDFGTTRTGVAYMRPGDPMPTQLGRWPGCENFMHKVPTVLRYMSGSKEDYEWGFVADKAGFGRSILFKTSLGSGEAHTYPDMSSKTAHGMISDFLNSVYNHIQKRLEEEGLDKLEMEFSFTVPATYSDPVVEEFRNIISKTSFLKHKFNVTLTEPEAAAIHTLYSQRSAEDFVVGEGIIVCDAGGGTIDVSSYQILQRGQAPRVKQMGIISGAPRGSIYIDKAFEDLLVEHGILQQLTNDERYKLRQQFILRKESFINDESRPNYHVELPRDGIQGELIVAGAGYVQISREMMIKFFEPSVSTTLHLLREHLKQCRAQNVKVEKIFLAGGLGSSQYLKKRIEDAFGADSIRVIQPADTASATVLGCIRDQVRELQGHTTTVESRRCPAHYGILVSHAFDSNTHNQADYHKDEYTGKAVARNQVEWFAKKGVEITNGSLTIPRQLRRTFKKCGIWEDVLVRCDSDDPPGRLGPEVKIICRLKTDMRKLPNSAFDRRKRYLGLKRFYEASYLVNMIIRPADLKFEMWFKNTLQSQFLDISWELDGVPISGGSQEDQVPQLSKTRVHTFRDRWLNPRQYPTEQAYAESSLSLYEQ